jgi:hypothetical protein
MNKVDRIKKDLEAIEKELQALSTFRKTPQLQKFIRQLHGERSFIKRQIDQASGIVHRRGATPEQLARAQHNRSEKNRRNWRYAKAISDTYGIPVRKVRSELKKRKEGLESDIKDVMWRNPSP